MDVLQRKRHFLCISPSICPFIEWRRNRVTTYSSIVVLLQKCGTPSNKCLIFTLLCLNLWIACSDNGEEGLKGQGVKCLSMLLFKGWWGNWKERNKRPFEDKTRSMWAIIDFIVSEISSWVLMKKEFKNCSLNDRVWDWGSCISDSNGANIVSIQLWTPQDMGKCK